MNMNTREKTLFRMTVAVVIIGILYFLIIDPMLNRMEEIDGREMAVAKREAELRRLLARRPDITDEIHALEERITSAAPRAMETDLYEDLSNIEKKSGVTPAGKDTIKKQPLRDGFEEIIMEIRLETDTRHLTDYLYWLETSPRQIKISRLTVTRSSRRGSKEASLSVSLRLSTVIKSAPEDTPSPPEEKPAPPPNPDKE